MKLTQEQREQLIADYNNENNIDNLTLSRRYGIAKPTVREILIKAGVYKPIRAPYGSGSNLSPSYIRKILSQNEAMWVALKKIAAWDVPNFPDELKSLSEKSYITSLASIVLKKNAKEEIKNSYASF